jgi:hypothetical protein
VAKQEPLYTAGGMQVIIINIRKPVWRFLKKLEIELPYDPEILLLGIYQKNVRQDTVETPVHQCSLQHYSQ